MTSTLDLLEKPIYTSRLLRVASCAKCAPDKARPFQVCGVCNIHFQRVTKLRNCDHMTTISCAQCATHYVVDCLRCDANDTSTLLQVSTCPTCTPIGYNDAARCPSCGSRNSIIYIMNGQSSRCSRCFNLFTIECDHSNGRHS